MYDKKYKTKELQKHTEMYEKEISENDTFAIILKKSRIKTNASKNIKRVCYICVCRL